MAFASVSGIATMQARLRLLAQPQQGQTVGIAPFLAQVRSRLPIRTGRLRESLHWRFRGGWLIMSLRAPYASNPRLIEKYGDYLDKAARASLRFLRGKAIYATYQYKRRDSRRGGQPTVRIKLRVERVRDGSVSR